MSRNKYETGIRETLLSDRPHSKTRIEHLDSKQFRDVQDWIAKQFELNPKHAKVLLGELLVCIQESYLNLAELEADMASTCRRCRKPTPGEFCSHECLAAWAESTGW